MNRDNNRLFSNFFAFFPWKQSYLIFWINWLYFFAEYTYHCPFFDDRYGSKVSNDVKNKKKVLQKIKFWRKISSVKNICRLKIFVGYQFRWLKNFVRWKWWNFSKISSLLTDEILTDKVNHVSLDRFWCVIGKFEKTENWSTT